MPDPLRIALVRRRYSPTGGAERYLERLAQSLMAQGCSISLWCESWPKSHSVIKEIYPLSSNSVESFAAAVQKAKIREKADLIFTLDRVPGCDLYRVGDGIHAEWLKHRAHYRPWIGTLSNWIKPKNRIVCQLDLEIFSDPALQGIIANSKMVKEEIVQRYGVPENKIQVIHNGIPYTTFSSGNRELGRKALQVAIDEYLVLLVGAGSERKGIRYLKAAIAGMSPSPRLVIISQPPSVELQHLYAAADVFALPTLYDPFANVTLEALAAGLPVITTRHNGAHEIITHEKNGVVLDRANNIEGIRKLLERFRDPKEREKFREPARQLAAQFTMERNVEETLKVIEAILEKKRVNQSAADTH